MGHPHPAPGGMAEKPVMIRKDGKLLKFEVVMSRQSRESRPQRRSVPSGPNSGDTVMITEDIILADSSRVDLNLQNEVASWKREARAEDNDRYFWHVNEVDQITRGDRYFVIGRKGSGKTAICEYFNRSTGPETFAVRLSFKNFHLMTCITIRINSIRIRINSSRYGST